MNSLPEQKLIQKDIAETTLIKYPRFRVLLDALQECYDSYDLTAQPLCKAMLGPSGAGKSTLGKYFCAKHSPEADGETPTLFVTVPPRVTYRSFAREFLVAMKDPYPSRGSASELGSRIDKAIGKGEGGHRVRVVILNECQRFADSPWIELYDCANFLRERIEKSGSSFVFLGLGYAAELIDQNDQLQRLFEETIPIDPFQWHRKEDQDEFIGILDWIRESLSGAYTFPRDFTEPDLAFRVSVRFSPS